MPARRGGRPRRPTAPAPRRAAGQGRGERAPCAQRRGRGSARRTPRPPTARAARAGGDRAAAAAADDRAEPGSPGRRAAPPAQRKAGQVSGSTRSMSLVSSARPSAPAVPIARACPGGTCRGRPGCRTGEKLSPDRRVCCRARRGPQAVCGLVDLAPGHDERWPAGRAGECVVRRETARRDRTDAGPVSVDEPRDPRGAGKPAEDEDRPGVGPGDVGDLAQGGVRCPEAVQPQRAVSGGPDPSDQQVGGGTAAGDDSNPGAVTADPKLMDDETVQRRGRDVDDGAAGRISRTCGVGVSSTVHISPAASQPGAVKAAAALNTGGGRPDANATAYTVAAIPTGPTQWRRTGPATARHGRATVRRSRADRAAHRR